MAAPTDTSSIANQMGSLSVESNWVVHENEPKVDPFVESMLRDGNGAICVAGGYAIMSAIDGLAHSELSDVDVWAIGNIPETIFVYPKTKAINDAIRWLKRSGPSVCVGQKGPSVLSFSLAHYPRNVQLIMPEEDDVKSLIERFDIDACQAALIWNVEKKKVELVTTLACRQAWKSRTILKANTWVQTMRLGKLCLRGFQLSPDVQKIVDGQMYVHSADEILKDMKTSHWVHTLDMHQAEVRSMMRSRLNTMEHGTFDCSTFLGKLIPFHTSKPTKGVIDRFGQRYNNSS